LEAVKGYSSCEFLDEASTVLFYFSHIPRLMQRIEIHETAFSWNPDCNFVSFQLKKIQEASDQILKSDDLKHLMALILAIGNYMNGGTSYGQVKQIN
jgi:hypothetical protein